LLVEGIAPSTFEWLLSYNKKNKLLPTFIIKCKSKRKKIMKKISQFLSPSYFLLQSFFFFFMIYTNSKLRYMPLFFEEDKTIFP